MEFRKATPLDAKGICGLEEICFFDSWKQRDIEDLLCDSHGIGFCVIDNGQVVAYLIGRLIAPEGEIYRIAVNPAMRKHGIGYRLLDYSYKTLKGKGLEVFYLEVRSQNVPAINLYSAYGFRVVGKRTNYYNNPKDDAILMMKSDRDYFQ